MKLRTRDNLGRWLILLALSPLAALAGCSSAGATGTPNTASGGQSSGGMATNQTAGSSASAASSTGGAANTGGAAPAAGGLAENGTGGSSGPGGSTASGGVQTDGGALATGGTAAATGGSAGASTIGNAGASTCTDQMAVDTNAQNSGGKLYPAIAALKVTRPGSSTIVKIRDMQITPEATPDGLYYLTGTTADKPDAWSDYDGIEAWSSPDLSTWTYLGFIWTFAQAAKDEPNAWYSKRYPYPSSNEPDGTLQVVWAPELHYIKGNWYLAFCMPGGYTGFIKSTSNAASGPWHNPITTGNGYIAKGHIDPSLFVDTNGTVYFVEDNGNGCQLKDDMSGCADATHKNFTGQSTSGDEGGSMFKAFDTYYFDVTVARGSTPDGKYSSWIVESPGIWGTYTKRYEGVPDAGHSNYFRDKQCRWWVTLFGNDSKAPVFNQPAIVPIEFDSNHHVRVDFRPR